jgi:hypothetical protein
MLMLSARQWRRLDEKERPALRRILVERANLQRAIHCYVQVVVLKDDPPLNGIDSAD